MGFNLSHNYRSAEVGFGSLQLEMDVVFGLWTVESHDWGGAKPRAQSESKQEPQICREIAWIKLHI